MTNTEPRWLTPEEQEIWRKWLAANSLLDVRLAADLRPFALDLSEYEVLVCLSEAPDRCLRMSDLAEAANQSRSRLTHTVGRMERRGLITRQATQHDRRGVTACLTDDGFRLLEAAAPGHVRAVRRWLVDVMTPEEYRGLGVAVTRILDADGSED